MTRDMDLIRHLLREINGDPRFDNVRKFQPDPGELGITEENFAQVAYTLRLLIEAGFVNGRTSMRMPLISGLTMSGHDLLDSIKDDGIWARTKAIATKAGGFTVEILADIAKSVIKEKLGRLTGGTLGV